MLLTTARLTSVKTLRSVSSCCKGQKGLLARNSRCERNSSSSSSCEFTLWDSFGKKTTPLISRRPDILTWYACGPTVYDSAHIGHASSYIRQDVIRRILERIGGKLCLVQVMGVTDIDDKIIKKAQQLEIPCESVSKKYELEFIQDLASLNVKPPHIRSRVTDFIPQIVDFVKTLLDKKLAYPITDGSVYFDTERYGKYGKFREVSDNVEAEYGQEKKSLKDFAVWKGSKPGEPFWLTPWGKGRPGWHIECSVMASHYFGSSLDIHSGGTDLVFPHHENEEAQCCAHFGIESWVSHWIHTGHLNIKGDVKMSKSLGNTISIQDFLQDNPYQLLRMFCILSKYQTSLEFSPGSVTHAKAMLRKFESFISDTEAITQGSKNVVQSQYINPWESLISTQNAVWTFLKNDFDTPSALQTVSEFIDSFNRLFTNDLSSKISSVDYGFVLCSSSFVKDFLSLVGIGEGKPEMQNESQSTNSRLDSVVSEFVQFRSQVRNYALAIGENDKKLRKEKTMDRRDLLHACDEARDRLNPFGIELKDHGKQTSKSFSSVGDKINNKN